MRISRVLLISILILGVAASCGKRSGDTRTPIAFVPVTTPGPGVEPQVQATGTLPPLPVLDVPTSGPRPEVAITRLEPQPGGGPVTVPGRLASGGKVHYLVAGQAGQSLLASLSLSQGLATLAVLGADGHMLPGTRPQATHWSGPLPTTQDYTLEITAIGGSAEVSYTLTISVAAAP